MKKWLSDRRIKPTDEDIKMMASLSESWKIAAMMNAQSDLTNELNITVKRLGPKILGALDEYSSMKLRESNE